MRQREWSVLSWIRARLAARTTPLPLGAPAGRFVSPVFPPLRSASAPVVTVLVLRLAMSGAKKGNAGGSKWNWRGMVPGGLFHTAVIVGHIKGAGGLWRTGTGG